MVPAAMVYQGRYEWGVINMTAPPPERKNHHNNVKSLLSQETGNGRNGSPHPTNERMTDGDREATRCRRKYVNRLSLTATPYILTPTFFYKIPPRTF